MLSYRDETLKTKTKEMYDGTRNFVKNTLDLKTTQTTDIRTFCLNGEGTFGKSIVSN